jgi:hypothetical protein
VLAADGSATANLSSLNGGALSGARNRIINGDCRIDQRASIITTTGSYFTDRWVVYANTTGAYQCAQSGAAPAGFTNSILFDVTTADTSIGASEFALISQTIEGLNTSDLSWGSASAQAITLSFWVNSTTTGTYYISIRNSAGNRSYIAEYSVSSANTWERKTITVPGDTSGTWLTTNGAGIILTFTFATGSTYQTTAGSWQAGNFLGTSAQINLLASTANEIRITGVQLEPGSVATPFERRSYGAELALCQRYYHRIYPGAGNQRYALGQATTTTQAIALITFPVSMRTAPSALEQSGTAGDYLVAYLTAAQACSAVPTFSTASTHVSTVNFTISSSLTAGNAVQCASNSSNSYLGWSAEL